MSKAEILAELRKLDPKEIHEVLEEICELQDAHLMRGGAPTGNEKACLDRELEDYRLNPDAGSSWEEVEARVLKRTRQ